MVVCAGDLSRVHPRLLPNSSRHWLKLSTSTDDWIDDLLRARPPATQLILLVKQFQRWHGGASVHQLTVMVWGIGASVDTHTICRALLNKLSCLTLITPSILNVRMCINSDVLMCFPPEGNAAPLSLNSPIWRICHAAALCSPAPCPQSEPAHAEPPKSKYLKVP